MVTTAAALTLPISTPSYLPLPTTTMAPGFQELSPSLESDTRVGWVYKLSKAAIQQILRDFNQSDEGKAEDLRKRLVKLIRNSPSEESRVMIPQQSKQSVTFAEPNYSLGTTSFHNSQRVLMLFLHQLKRYRQLMSRIHND